MRLSWFSRKKRPDMLSLLPPDDLPRTAPLVKRDLNFPSFDRWSSHPGFGLTPKTIVDIYRAAEAGYPKEQCDLFDDVVESDASLRSQLESRLNAVAGKTWAWHPGGNDPADIAVAQLLDEACHRAENFGELLRHQLTANPYGYALSETQWDFDEAQNVVPAWFANVPQRRFMFDPFDEPRLLTAAEMSLGEALEPGRWIYSHRHGRNVASSGLLRTATWWSLFKRLSTRDWVIFAERFGLPYVTGQYAEGTPEQEKEILRRAARSLGKDGTATFSKACDLVIHQASGGKADGVHGALIDLCNAEISKLISGATLTSGEGTSAGSYALGKTHADRSFELVVADTEELTRRLRQSLALPFIRFNGFNAKVPRLQIGIVREMDPIKRAQQFSIYANELGGELDADQVREEMQIKKPAGEKLIGNKNKGPDGAPPSEAPISATP